MRFMLFKYFGLFIFKYRSSIKKKWKKNSLHSQPDYYKQHEVFFRISYFCNNPRPSLLRPSLGIALILKRKAKFDIWNIFYDLVKLIFKTYRLHILNSLLRKISQQFSSLQQLNSSKINIDKEVFFSLFSILYDNRTVTDEKLSKLVVFIGEISSIIELLYHY